MEKRKFICTECGSENIIFDANVRWDKEKQTNVINDIFPDCICLDCDEEMDVCEKITYQSTPDKQTTKDELIDLINYMDSKQQEFLRDLLKTLSTDMIGKNEIAKLAGIEGTFDTALPADYIRSIQEIHPNFNTFAHVYDYSKATYGEMNNVMEKLVLKMHDVFSE